MHTLIFSSAISLGTDSGSTVRIRQQLLIPMNGQSVDLSNILIPGIILRYGFGKPSASRVKIFTDISVSDFDEGAPPLRQV